MRALSIGSEEESASLPSFKPETECAQGPEEEHHCREEEGACGPDPDENRLRSRKTRSRRTGPRLNAGLWRGAGPQRDTGQRRGARPSSTPGRGEKRGRDDLPAYRAAAAARCQATARHWATAPKCGDAAVYRAAATYQAEDPCIIKKLTNKFR